MKRIFLVVVLLLCASILLVGCKVKNKNITINYQRRLMPYLPADSSGSVSSKGAGNIKLIDLSEGSKLKYDANFGPSDVIFDFKIVNPYKY